MTTQETARRIRERQSDRAIRDPGAYTIEHGGGTFRADTLDPVEPMSGYAVGMTWGTASRAHRLADADTIRTLMMDVRRSNPRANYIGTWRDDAGTTHIDPVMILPDLASALIVARAFGQKAIWSFELREEISA